MRAYSASSALITALLLTLFGMRPVSAQDVPDLLHREVSERWVAARDPATGIVSLISPSYALGSGCVINELTAPLAGIESGNLASSRLLKRLFVGLEGRSCSEIPAEWYADIYEPDPPYDVMRFAVRVANSDGVEAGVESQVDRRRVSECVGGIPSGAARIVTIRSAFDFDESGDYIAEISCDLIPPGQRVIARGVPWGGGKIVWTIIPLPAHPH